MASFPTCNTKRVLFFSLAFLSCLNQGSVMCRELDVGGDRGWATPKKDQFYNEWASENRFQVDDVLRFAYEKDSVLQVTEEDYNKCRTSQPMFFSNTGDTDFRFERPGLFYFISGVSGHCERGLKMVVKVLEPETPPSNTTASPPPKSGAAGEAGLQGSVAFLHIILTILSLFRAVSV